MNDKTTVTYHSPIGRVVFKQADGLWPFALAEIQGASTIGVTLHETFAAGMPGSSITGRQTQPRLVTISGWLTGNVEETRRQLLACVAPGMPARLTVETENGESFYLEGEPTITPEITDGAGVQNFQFQFKCPYPYWRTASVLSHGSRQLQHGFGFPLNLPNQWRVALYQDFKQIEAINEGNIATGVVLAVTALKNTQGPLKITNYTTGEFVELLHPMQENDRFELCTEAGNRYAISREKGQTLNGYYRLAYGSSLKFALAPGGNSIMLEYPGGDGALLVEIKAPKGVLAGV